MQAFTLLSTNKLNKVQNIIESAFEIWLKDYLDCDRKIVDVTVFNAFEAGEIQLHDYHRKNYNGCVIFASLPHNIEKLFASIILDQVLTVGFDDNVYQNSSIFNDVVNKSLEYFYGYIVQPNESCKEKYTDDEYLLKKGYGSAIVTIKYKTYIASILIPLSTLQLMIEWDREDSENQLPIVQLNVGMLNADRYINAVATLNGTNLSISELTSLSIGDYLVLEQKANASVDLFVNDNFLSKCHLGKIGEQKALGITKQIG